VDVRDVAHAHVLAMENEKAKGRYLCTSETLGMSEVVDILRKGSEPSFERTLAEVWNTITAKSGRSLG